MLTIVTTISTKIDAAHMILISCNTSHHLHTNTMSLPALWNRSKRTGEIAEFLAVHTTLLTQRNEQKLDVGLPVWGFGREVLHIWPQYRVDVCISSHDAHLDGCWTSSIAVTTVLTKQSQHSLVDN